MAEECLSKESIACSTRVRRAEGVQEQSRSYTLSESPPSRNIFTWQDALAGLGAAHRAVSPREIAHSLLSRVAGLSKHIPALRASSLLTENTEATVFGVSQSDSDGMSGFSDEVVGAQKNTVDDELTPVVRVTDISPRATKHIIRIHGIEGTESFASYTNFADQFEQGKALLDEHSADAVCLFLTQDRLGQDGQIHQEVTFHQMRRTVSGYTIQQIPAIHKLGWASRDDVERNRESFAHILGAGFEGGKHVTHGEPNVILAPEGQRDYFHWTRQSNAEEGDDYFLELWSSDVRYGETPPSASLFQSVDSLRHNLFAHIQRTFPEDISGVIVLPAHLTTRDVQRSIDYYSNVLPRDEVTFFQRETVSQIVEPNASSIIKKFASSAASEEAAQKLKRIEYQGISSSPEHALDDIRQNVLEGASQIVPDSTS